MTDSASCQALRGVVGTRSSQSMISERDEVETRSFSVLNPKCIPPNAHFVSLCIGGVTYNVKDAADVLIHVCRWLAMPLMRNMRSRNIIWLGPKPNGMKRPYNLSGAFYVELGGSNLEILKRAAQAMSWSNYSETSVRIACEVPKEERWQRDAHNADAVTLDMKRIAEVFESGFPNGMRPGSIIDQNKMRRFYREKFNEDIPEDFDFQVVLPRIGVAVQGKIFPRPKTDGSSGWESLLTKLVANGHKIFRFATVMDLHREELVSDGVLSAEMLRKVIGMLANRVYAVSEDYFAPVGCSTDPTVAIAETISQGDDEIVEIDKVAAMLPYLEKSDILDYLKAAPQYCWNTVDSYANTKLLEFDGVEIEKGKELCGRQIEKDGYFSLSQLELAKSAMLNSSRLQMSVLRIAFFNRFLSEDYKRRGQIVAPCGAEVDACAPILAFCKDRSEVTLCQIEEIAKECNIQLPWALCAVQGTGGMVRVDKDRFVNMDLIEWDRDGIEAAIEKICVSNVLPLGAVHDFSDFPSVPGFPWNSYLLHDYIKHESEADENGKFFINGVSYASKTVAGLIVRKDTKFMNTGGLAMRDEAFAMAAVEAGIKPDADAVGDFLMDQKCILRRSTDLQSRVAAEMKKMEGRK